MGKQAELNLSSASVNIDYFLETYHVKRKTKNVQFPEFDLFTLSYIIYIIMNTNMQPTCNYD